MNRYTGLKRRSNSSSKYLAEGCVSPVKGHFAFERKWKLYARNPQNTANVRYLEYGLSRTFVMSNTFSSPLSFELVFPYKYNLISRTPLYRTFAISNKYHGPLCQNAEYVGLSDQN